MELGSGSFVDGLRSFKLDIVLKRIILEFLEFDLEIDCRSETNENIELVVKPHDSSSIRSIKDLKSALDFTDVFSELSDFKVL
jgi:hypothetical protein